MHIKHIPLILACVAAVAFIVGYVVVSHRIGAIQQGAQTMMGKSVVTPIIPRASETASAAQ